MRPFGKGTHRDNECLIFLCLYIIRQREALEGNRPSPEPEVVVGRDEKVGRSVQRIINYLWAAQANERTQQTCREAGMRTLATLCRLAALWEANHSADGTI